MKSLSSTAPRRFLKKKDVSNSIICYPDCGPIFGSSWKQCDLYIRDRCNEEGSCYSQFNKKSAYHFSPLSHSSFFNDTTDSRKSKTYYFTIQDYEVYSVDFTSKYTIYHACKYPELIWEYQETKDISSVSLQSFDDDIGLLKDLNSIERQQDILMKVSRCCLHHPSSLFSETSIASSEYDSYFHQWIPTVQKWKLIYRASEHDYTAKSFHECCDDQGPTLILFKSTEGYIFGGYTTQSWKGLSIF